MTAIRAFFEREVAAALPFGADPLLHLTAAG
jgi:hypothetical protein